MTEETSKPSGKCPNCGTEYSPTAKFCPECATPLKSVDSRLRAEVDAYLAERTKDRHVVEVEICESVIGRIEKWTKLFLWVIGAPIGIILIGLGIFGFNKVQDINALAAKVDNEIRPKAEKAVKDADEASTKISDANKKADDIVADVNKELTAARANNAKMKELSDKVAALEKQNAANVSSATKRIEGQLSDLDQRVQDAQTQINDQQKKLTDTGELVMSLFSNSRVESFDASMTGRYVVREGNNRRVVIMLLSKIPIPQSIQIQWHVATQPKDSYFAFKNVLVFFWGDPKERLKEHPLLVSYVAAPNPTDKPYNTLSLNADGHAVVDSIALPDYK